MTKHRTFTVVSRAPLDKLLAYRERMARLVG
jgi:hypothetical protein